MDIMDYVFSPVTTADKADYVAMLVEDFNGLYPERRLIPKMHYMIHLSSWMKWYIKFYLTCFVYTVVAPIHMSELISI